jgi:hypothetical protein
MFIYPPKMRKLWIYEQTEVIKSINRVDNGRYQIRLKWSNDWFVLTETETVEQIRIQVQTPPSLDRKTELSETKEMQLVKSDQRKCGIEISVKTMLMGFH